MPRKRVTAASQRHFDKASRHLPLGVCDTYRYWGEKETLYIASGRGGEVTDIDGNTYIDFRLGWGPVILGYCDERVDRAVKAAIDNGGSFGLSTCLEAEVAERISRLVPSVEQVRFATSGSEAVGAALRIARGKTGRKKIVLVEGCFHGLFDQVMIRTDLEAWRPDERRAPAIVPFGAGIPPVVQHDIVVVPFNDIEALKNLFRQHGDQIAAFLVEPYLGNSCAIPADATWLHEVRLLCDLNGTVLIFDEVKTGFRLGRGGAQGIYGIEPDLTTFAKAIANGFPIAAVGGRRDVMSAISGFSGVIQGGTFVGHPLGLAAAQATLDIIRDTRALDTVAEFGTRIQEMLARQLRQRGITHCFSGHPSMFSLMMMERCPRDYRAWRQSDYRFRDRLAANLLDEGVLIEPDSREPFFICEAHQAIDFDDLEDRFKRAIEQTIAAA